MYCLVCFEILKCKLEQINYFGWGCPLSFTHNCVVSVSSSLCLGQVALFYYGSPWAFHIITLKIYKKCDIQPWQNSIYLSLLRQSFSDHHLRIDKCPTFFRTDLCYFCPLSGFKTFDFILIRLVSFITVKCRHSVVRGRVGAIKLYYTVCKNWWSPTVLNRNKN